MSQLETESTHDARDAQMPSFRYEQTSALYASQFAVNTLEDSVLIDCSSGFLMDEGHPYLPVQSRLALSAATARKLGETLILVADELESVEECASSLGAAASLHDSLAESAAKLPRWED